MNGVREICKCGHDISTHFDKAFTCLGMACDCKRYREPGTPDDLPPRPKTHALWCRCFLCKQYTDDETAKKFDPRYKDDEAPDTWPTRFP